MKTSEKMIKQGYWLFRYRSYLPLLILAFALVCMWVYRGHYRRESVGFDLLCAFISLCGEAIRVITVGFAPNRTSGRNTTSQVAKEINQTGIYSLIRHPLYLGNFFMWLGVAVFTRIWWLMLIFILIYWLYYERIILAEEEFLTIKFGTEYDKYASKVNAILPGLHSYQANKYKFRFKKVLRQDYSSYYGLLVVFIMIELFQDWVSRGNIHLELYWIVSGLLFTLIYLILLALWKWTRILQIEKQAEKTSC